MGTGLSESADTIAAPAPTKRLPATITVIIAAMMVLIDSTITNVALTDMMGALGATSDQITWVLTSFIMAEAIFIPLTGYFTRRLGERSLLLWSVAGFIATSALCGQADSLNEMIFFRILQGLFGASVIPLAQSVLIQVYPKDQRGKAMAIFSIGVMLGPILGPVIGGIITEHINWRWIFYVNLPIGLVCMFLIAQNIHINNRGKTEVDWLVIATMAIGIGLLQMVLSEGNEKNWFSSNVILYSAILSGLALAIFVFRSLTTKGPTAPIWLLRDRNLFTSCLMVFGFGMCTYGSLALQPLMLQGVFNYPVETTGFIMAPRGITSALVLISAASLIDKIDNRLPIFIGLTLSAIGIWFMTQYTPQTDPFWMIFPTMIQGAGMGLVFAPLANIAFATLDPERITDGASLFSLLRTIGSSVGIAVSSTFYSQVEQKEWHSLSGALSPDNPLLQQFAQQRGGLMTDTLFLEELAELVEQQASLLGFTMAFGLLFLIYIVLIFLLPLLRTPPKKE